MAIQKCENDCEVIFTSKILKILAFLGISLKWKTNFTGNLHASKYLLWYLDPLSFSLFISSYKPTIGLRSTASMTCSSSSENNKCKTQFVFTWSLDRVELVSRKWYHFSINSELTSM